jgi:hypothetical protein
MVVATFTMAVLSCVVGPHEVEEGASCLNNNNNLESLL